jgi:protocatechuate 3,4-dioxygenase alpha subunit
VFARGLLRHLTTRIYLREPGPDPVWESVPPERRQTMMATPSEDGYRFDIRLQGDDETVFFDV